MRIAICDDNSSHIDLIRDYVLEFNQEYNILAYDNGLALCDDLRDGKKTDIILLDVEMPGKNGIEIGKEIRTFNSNVIIIYCTSYPEYAVDSYDCDAFYYLVKPLTKEKLHSVLVKAINRIYYDKKYISIQQRGIPIKILLSDIYYIECLQKHLIYHTKNEDIQIPGKISVAYDEVKDYGFFMVHQGYIVNFKKAIKIEGNNILLENKQIVPISVRKKAETLIAYARFLEKSI